MPRPEKAIRARDRETHRVLATASDPNRLRISFPRAVKTRMGCNEECAVNWIDTEAVDMHGPCVYRPRLVVSETARDGDDRGNDDQRRNWEPGYESADGASTPAGKDAGALCAASQTGAAHSISTSSRRPYSFVGSVQDVDASL